MSGAAALPVTFTYSFDINAQGAAGNQFIVDFGDGTHGFMNVVNVAQVSHTYTTPGTYTATISYESGVDANGLRNTSGFVPLTDSSGNHLAQTITVTGSTSGTPTASIDQSSLTTSSANPTITGAASGVTSIGVSIDQSFYSPTSPSPSLQATDVPVINGRWSATVQNNPVALQLIPGQTYVVTVFYNVPDKGQSVLATGTLTVTH